MSISTYYPKKIPPEIEVYPKNMGCKIEYILNPCLEHVLAHELVHLLIRKHNEEDIPEESRKVLLKINKMIDNNGYS